MSRAKRGFTLIELLVVITVIGMLLALLMPGINAVKESMRRTSCANNMSQLGKAMMTLVNSTARQKFPGYSNKIELATANEKPVSWGVMLLPYLDQQALYDRIKGSKTVTGDRGTTVQIYMEVFNCPSNPPENFGKDFSSMVANCGRPDTKPETSADGIFFNKSKSGSVDFTVAHIVDGQTNTIMLTENVNGGSWAHNFAGGGAVQEAAIGFNWWDTDKDSSNAVLPYRKINGLKNKPVLDNGTTVPLTELARPSSNHSGGVNVVFADGQRCIWLKEGIAYYVYQQLMTPDGMKAAIVAKVNTSDTLPYLLNEGDYK